MSTLYVPKGASLGSVNVYLNLPVEIAVDVPLSKTLPSGL